MNETLIIIDSSEIWEPYYKSKSVITADTYLQEEKFSKAPYLVINLCSNLGYLSEGYYCSLLAQARKHKILPTIETLNRLESDLLLKTNSSLQRFCSSRYNLPEDSENGGYALDLFFGKCEDPRLDKLARAVYDYFPAPLLRIHLSGSQPFNITRIRSLSLEELDDHQQDLFANHLDSFSKKVWRVPRSRKPSRYDLAILHDPSEPFPPSNRSALNLFLGEARKMDIKAELITADDTDRFLEFDALFIRQTTAVDNITYKLAQAAEQAGMVVIDDPSSIICCTNKVFLQELLDRKSIPSPGSMLLFKKHTPAYEEISAELGKTMVIKIPDGSFSVGVNKIDDESSFDRSLAELFKKSSVLLAQEFLPTLYDWRIGVLNGESIYACKYYMARGHWQIYRHLPKGNTRSGRFETLPVHQVPRRITKLAEKVAGCIGRGLYGVDIKETDYGLKVIEINDNPSIEHGVEDKILGAELYRIILREFVARLDSKRSK
jgi:glutathione synthase/RimK-type ligase-like ATP-grasp enzyme